METTKRTNANWAKAKTNINFVAKENVSNFLKHEHDLGISSLEDYLGEVPDRFHKFNPF